MFSRPLTTPNKRKIKDISVRESAKWKILDRSEALARQTHQTQFNVILTRFNLTHKSNPSTFEASNIYASAFMNNNWKKLNSQIQLDLNIVDSERYTANREKRKTLFETSMLLLYQKVCYGLWYLDWIDVLRGRLPDNF